MPFYWPKCAITTPLSHAVSHVDATTISNATPSANATQLAHATLSVYVALLSNATLSIDAIEQFYAANAINAVLPVVKLVRFGNVGSEL